MLNQKPSFRFEIDNFSKKESAIKSQTFLNGGCQWYLYVHPKGNRLAENHHLSLSLYVANIKSLQTGWKRSADYYFRVLDQSGIELYTSPHAENNLFCAKSAGRVFEKTLPIRKLQKKGFLKNDKLIIEVYINVVEALDGKVKENITKKKETKTVEINGFRFLASQVTLVRKIFEEHPDIIEDLKPKNQVVKTEYMNVLLNLIETLDKPSKKHSETELSNAQSELCELIEQGFKLDWLRSKLGKLSLNRKKVDDDGSLVKQFEKRLKNLELMELGSLESKLEGLSLETKKACDVDRSRVQQLEERFKNLELMESGFKMEKSKIARVYLEMKKATADGSLVQKLEERLKNLELMVSNLKVELDEKKDQSCDDEFLLVDEVD